MWRLLEDIQHQVSLSALARNLHVWGVCVVLSQLFCPSEDIKADEMMNEF